MATIPEEYADFDFGFSAVDDEEYKAKTTEVEKKIVEVEAKSENLENLEKKLDAAITEINYNKEYQEEKHHHALISIDHRVIRVEAYTRDIDAVTHMDKKLAKFCDELYEDVTYISERIK